MFWRFGFHNASAIDGLLDKEGLTLDELLEEEETLQECKAHNTKLVEFLCKPEVLKQLLGFIMNSDDLEEAKRFKYPYLACEILSCEIFSICEGIVSNEELMNDFWTLLDRPAPLNPLTASYFSKVNGVLLSKKMPEMITFIRKQPNVVQRLLSHVGSSAISDLLLKLISMEELPEGSGTVEWLSKEGLIPSLLNRMDPKLDSEVHNTAAQTLLDVIAVSYQTIGPQEILPTGLGGSVLGEQPALTTSISGNTLVDELKSEEMMNKLASYMLDERSPQSATTLVNGINIIIELIRRYCSEIEQAEYQQHQYQQQPVTQRTGPPPPAPEKLRALATDLNDLLHVIGSRLTQFSQLLHGSHYLEEKDAPVGKAPTLGSERLKTCELFAEILHLQYLYTSSPLFERLITVHHGHPDKSDSDEDSGKTELTPKSPTEQSAPSATESTPPARSVANELVSLTNKFIDAKILPVCLDLFFRFPWNNFLHSVVYDMIAKVFNTYSYTSTTNLPKAPTALPGDDEGIVPQEAISPAQSAVEAQMGAVKIIVRRLVLSIFKDGELTKQITRAQRQNDAQVAKPKGVRLGYMGHLTYIADEVCKLLDKCNEDLSKELGELVVAEDWQNYVLGALKETRERDRQPLGGVRPNGGPQQHQVPIMGGVGGSFTGGPDEADGLKIGGTVIKREPDEDEDEMDPTNAGDAFMGDGDVSSDQFARFLCHQIVADLPDRFIGVDNSDDEDDGEDGGSGWLG
ncbi:SIT4 phosphatase-associated protein-domain-containing protein [Fimicolochytrium jonesii]|uniref:SIT4 phosphatase-associated protein-domain-containing protein n=1 Tax=Fimicolochytrium jonesii TaxID=1396493 RepID=UPI0022FF03E6|nr:SIT4 phosphatase-associated protein-domain-containing protein [Fimicolochytrium jonesii]KAI8823077.1 SIT4 phosphatase-associated protein-domain-containing protein [Fimicolochytrium jonesii]